MDICMVVIGIFVDIVLRFVFVGWCFLFRSELLYFYLIIIGVDVLWDKWWWSLDCILVIEWVWFVGGEVVLVNVRVFVVRLKWLWVLINFGIIVVLWRLIMLYWFLVVVLMFCFCFIVVIWLFWINIVLVIGLLLIIVRILLLM